MDFDRSCRDLISELNQDITDIILSKLPIRDAVKTCILSRKWRYKWASMTRIVFDFRGTNEHHNMVRFLNGFLSKHVGPIHKCALRVGYYGRDFLEVDRWIPYFRRKHVKELILQLDNGCKNNVEMSPGIFSCKNLTRLDLELYSCTLTPPPSFAGFSYMKHLVLKYVTIPLKDIERLISSCQLLESLTLGPNVRSGLTIRAPNLKRLNVEGGFKDICLENTPLLVDLTVSLLSIEVSSTDSCLLEKLLGGVPKLERLCGQHSFAYYLSAGCGGRRRFIAYEFLNHIELSALDVDYPEKVLVALHLIFSSPNLQELLIECRSCSPHGEIKGAFVDYFKDPFLANRTMNRLELVKISGSRPNDWAFAKLIKFLLDRSPSLVKMIIKPSELRVVSERRRQLISSFRRASHKASIVFPNCKCKI